MSVVIETTVGDLTVDLFTEDRPIACLNFLKLCKLKYYNFNLFHKVEEGFIAQTGDPTGVGDGGSSIWGVIETSQKRFFEAEYLPKIYHNTAGLLSLVSPGNHMVGSQFFLTLAPDLRSLDGVHCVIGEVVEGHDVLRILNEAIVDENHRPYQDIRITHMVVLDDPFPDPRGFQVPSRSPSPSEERLQNGRIAADEDIDDTEGKTIEEIQEMLAEREAKARATILEIIGDLPDADMAPPENVLFVCKLNPVTSEEDLEIIFSRFGKVKSCEVIRDRKSGESLQYAFVEFEDQKACEAAYFKMDNVLIDDRRIHVDFSQSVAKVKWRGKGRGVEGEGGRLDFNNLREAPKNQSRNNRDNRENKFERASKQNENRRMEPSQRMSSAERRKAREERHKEMDRRDRRRSRSRSGSRSRNHRSRSTDRSRYNKNDERDAYRRREPVHNDRNRNERRRSPYDNRSGGGGGGDRDRDRERQRGRENERSYSRNQGRSPYRREQDSYRDKDESSRGGDRNNYRSNRDSREKSPNRRKDYNDSRREGRDVAQGSYPVSKKPEREYRPRDDDLRNGRSNRNVEKSSSDRRNVQNKKRSKKSSSEESSSSSDSESGDSSEDSSSSSSDSSSTSSSSEDERRKRSKKTQKKKQSKSKNKKRKSKSKR